MGAAVIEQVALVLGVLYLVACVVAGIGVPGKLASFRCSGLESERRFRARPADVADAYAEAAEQTVGMRVVERDGNAVLVDLRPSLRVWGANFGLVMRFDVWPVGEGAVVRGQARVKVPFAGWMNRPGGFARAERLLERRIERSGLLAGREFCGREA